MNTIQLKDFLGFSYLSDVLMSQDGSHAAYLRHQCDAEADAYVSELWLTGLSGEGSLICSGKKKPLFAWESGETLLYGYPEKGQTPFVRHYAASGLTVPAFTVPLEARGLEPVGGGKYLVSAKTVLNPEDYQDDDCVIVTELPTQSNGTGYISGTRASLFLYDSLSGETAQITPPLFDVMQFSLCREQGKIVISGQSYEGKRIIKGGVSVYDLESGEFRQVVEPGTYRITYASMLGGQVIFAGTLGLYNTIMENPHFYLLSLETGEVTDLAYPDLYIGGLTVGSDCRYGGGIHCKAADGSVFFTSAKVGDSHLFELNAAGETRQVTRLPGSVDCFDVSNGRCVMVGMRDMGLEEVYALDLSTGEERALTDFNGEFTRTHEVVRPKPLFFQNDEGSTVSGWVMEPLGYDPARRYPAILDIHGGPKGTYGEVYYHEMQIWAQAGYFVFFCNPRGSDGHGDVYSRIMGLNGTKDYDDIMRFTDLVLEKYPQIDAGRVGVTGGSYGGYMTNWIVGHTDRFRCAATQRSIGDWMVHEYNCDTGYWVTSENFPPNAIVSAQAAWDDSPAKYAINCKTPLLFIHSDRDTRCTLPEAMAAYASAVRAGATVRMCLFHGENHELSRSGKPLNRVKRLEEITAWMDRYLKEGQA